MFTTQYPNMQAPLQQTMGQASSQSIFQYGQDDHQSMQIQDNQNQVASEMKQNSQNFAANNMVMIDQNELLELLQIKQQLMSQKQAAAAQPTMPRYEGQGFQSALFVSPPKTEFKEIEANISGTNSTSDRSSDKSVNYDQTETKTRSQIIQAPKQTSLFSMDFLEDDDSVDQAKSEEVQQTTRSQEGKESSDELDENLMKLIGDFSDEKDQTQVNTIDNLVQNFQACDLSQDMPSSISSQHESNSNQSFEEPAKEYFPQVSQQLYFPPLQQVQAQVQMPTIAQVNELAQVTRSAGGMKPLHQTNFTPTFNTFHTDEAVQETETFFNEKKNDFKFPDGGWECSKCQNYNFKGRKECHRCKKAKCEDDSEGMPTHLTMSAPQRAELKKKGLLKKDSKDTESEEVEVKKSCCAAKAAPIVSKKIQERVGDWTCQRCFNHNFAFRDVCNMCYMSHIESNKMLYGQQSQRYEQVQNFQSFATQVPQQQYQAFQMQMPMMQPQASSMSMMSCNAPAWTPKF